MTEENTAVQSGSKALVAQLESVVGAQHVLRGAADREFYSSDVYFCGPIAEMIVRPGTVEEVQRVVAVATSRGRVVIPRGGGLSYTGGYVPLTEASIIVDLGRLDRIVEVNAQDMYVTVEAGVTWRALYEQLRACSLRTPFFGNMSGYGSTVGGALSQGSVFLGSTQYGSAADSLLALEVVLADGTLLSTGSAAGRVAASPFFRNYGPDLAGVFLGDTGALGFKVRATLKLIPFPPHSRFASFAYPDSDSQLRALAEISRQGLAAECFGSDPFVSNLRFYDADAAQERRYARGVLRSSGSFLKGAVAVARMALAGRQGAGAGAYLLNVVIDEHSAAGANAKLRSVRAVAGREGRAVEPTAPRALRALPFVPPNSILGPRGERWVPVNSLSPHSRAPQVMREIKAFLEARHAQLERYEIKWGYVVLAISGSVTLIEPLFYWPDAWRIYHERVVEAEYLQRLTRFTPNSEAAAAVHEIRAGLAELFSRLGCAHLQIGKTYPYRQTRQPATYALLEAIKNHLDPERRVNPGSLGLE